MINQELNHNINTINNSFSILAVFSRVFDDYHINNNRIHLLTSICLSQGLELTSLGNKFRDDIGIYNNEVLYIFIIVPHELLSVSDSDS